LLISHDHSKDAATNAEREFLLMNLQGKTIFITGGASGLGAACARRLSQQGTNVVIADLNQEAGKTLAQELGEQALFAPTNVTDENSVQQALQSAVTKFGGIQGVINCAGIGAAAKVIGREGPEKLENFTRVITINLIGTFNVIRLAGVIMSQNTPEESGERGIIINTASIAAFDGQIGQAAYSASKGGIVGMTLPIAREFSRYGIRVMTIAPGIFDTPLLGALPELARKSLEQQVPFPSRLGRPAEYAALAQHIIENEMLNGEVVRLDGGVRMGPK
jgi:NAD(P)-dependent dehydrogenase (short-subunit alcohol dehydrogenase family)